MIFRYKRLEKAFELAKRIGAKDLFMVWFNELCIKSYFYIALFRKIFHAHYYQVTLQDVHYMAKDLGEHKLADSAKECAKKAASDFVSGMYMYAHMLNNY